MRTLTLHEINDLENGIAIPRFVAKIRKVWPQKSGVGQYGEWHLQNLTVEGDNQEMTVTWTGEDSMDGWEGRTVAFECGENKDNKLVGVTRDIRGFKGKTYEGVKVTPAGKIKLLGAEETAVHDADKEVSAWEQEDARRRVYEIRAKGEHFQEPPPDAPQAPPARSDADKIQSYAEHSRKVFMVAWEEAKQVMATIPSKDAEELSSFEWLDLRLRIAQGFAIETNKIIRKERF